MDKPKIRRKRTPQSVVQSYYLPIWLAEHIKELADEEYGGNRSDLVTQKLTAGLGIEQPKEAQLQPA